MTTIFTTPSPPATLRIPSAEAPMQNFTTNLLPILENEGFYAFLRSFPDLADSIRDKRSTDEFQKANITTDRTVSHFDQDFQQQWIMAKLAAAIPLAGLKSILAGTVAYDNYNKAVDDWYPVSGPGVYVVALAIQGRGGKFLSREETKKLRRYLERYCRGASALLNRDTTETAKSDIDFVKVVDHERGAPPTGRVTQFIENTEELKRIRCLAERFSRRCNAQLDPTGLVQQIQSPLYVGCSDKLETRSQDYLNLDVSNIDNIDKTLGLTISILSHMSLIPQIVFRVALPVWENNLMPRAGRLVATLASSYIWQGGFNATDPTGKGSTASLARLQAARTQAFGVKPYMEENLDSALKDIDRRIEFLEELEALMDSQEKLMKRLDKLEERPSRPVPLDQLMAQAEANHKILEAEMEERRRRHQLKKAFYELAKILLGKD